MLELEPVCPRCRGPLEQEATGHRCGACGTGYPVVAGIPDLRVLPDPYIGLEEDRAKARRLAAVAEESTFAELVDHYYTITPEVPAELAARYREHHLAGPVRGGGVLERLEIYGLGDLTAPGGLVLDLGCGSGGFLRAAAGAGLQPVGVDAALRWLVVARRGLEEAGRPGVPLFAASAEALPFPPAAFDLVVAEGLLEHTPRPGRVLSEARRVMVPGGGFAARTVNRFAPAPDPHMGLWLLGFLPRRAMGPYVRWRRGVPYRHVFLRSRRELTRLLRRGGLRGWKLRRPAITAGDVAHQPPRNRRLLILYDRLGRWLPPLRPLLARFGPYLDVAGR